MYILACLERSEAINSLAHLLQQNTKLVRVKISFSSLVHLLCIV